ncbi:hypothetical protein BG011_005885 [Mortierella polycephala]|uniref:F-box domain-containing protein n=1 Tax=Mortierella polycephala TaxID=41804 RepID=A0A9P6U0Q3_9FUNG|nr:hypothetical protein BG011_005885 [Mortierella polycephala]
MFITDDGRTHSVMGRIPIEIIEIIGQHLDGPTFLSALQVCQLWYNALSPFVWTSFSRTQWHHPEFPIQRNIRSHNSNSVPLSNLHRVRHLEWQCNKSLTRMDSGLQNRKAFKLRKQLLLPQLETLLFERVPNLCSLTFKRLQVLPSTWILQGLGRLTNLTRLEVEAYSVAIELESLFPMLSHLEELKLLGSWFHLDPARHTRPLLREDEGAWQLKKLTMERSAIQLLWYCPDLRELQINQGGPFTKASPQVSLLPMSTCTNLAILRFLCWPHSRHTNAHETFSGLKKIKSFTSHVCSIWLLGLLCDEDGFPLLEHLELKSINFPAVMSSDIVNRSLVRILYTRPRLKSFVVRQFQADPMIIFAQQPRMTSSQLGWVCKDLETLSCELKWEIGQVKEAGQKLDMWLWEPIYRQIGQLSKLRSLSIQCNFFDKSMEAGIQQLSGAKELRALSLSFHSIYFWSKNDIVMLVQAVPKLEYMYFQRFPVGHALQVRKWLRECGCQAKLYDRTPRWRRYMS